MKLHLCCGDIYLKDYVNIDKVGSLARADGLYCCPTDLDHYYRDRIIGVPRAIIVDRWMDLEQAPWDIADRSVDEIVMIQAIEHFRPDAAADILLEIKRILAPGGRLLVDFPDLQETVCVLLPVNPRLAVRHLYGSSRNRHLWGYTHETFRELLGEGWSRIEFREIVQHDYPVIGCEAVRL